MPRNGLLVQFLSLVSLAAGCAPVNSELTCDSGTPFCITRQVLEDDRPQALGIDIDSVALYQGVERIALIAGTEPEPSTLPLVSGRDALVRVLFKRHEGWTTSRTLTGRLYLYKDKKLLAAYQNDHEVTQDSAWADLATTFNFTVDGALLDGEIEYQIKIVEASSDAVGEGEAGINVWPSDDARSWTFASSGDAIRMLIIPIQYNSDGSGRLPDTSDEQIALIRDTILAMFPVRDIIIDVGDPYPTDLNVRPTSNEDWASLLSAVADLRQTYNALDDVYLYGLFEGAGDIATYCEAGCNTGMSLKATTATDVPNRAAIGIGFTGNDSARAMPHELGHTHGLSHAACPDDLTTVDDNYPEEIPGGSLDFRGYDLLSKSLKEANTNFDIMTMCSPQWISGYHWTALFERIQEVNLTYRNEDAETARTRSDADPTRQRW